MPPPNGCDKNPQPRLKSTCESREPGLLPNIGKDNLSLWLLEPDNIPSCSLVTYNNVGAFRANNICFWRCNQSKLFQKLCKCCFVLFFIFRVPCIAFIALFSKNHTLGLFFSPPQILINENANGYIGRWHKHQQAHLITASNSDLLDY